jgi:hypothetical protein
MHYPVKGIRNTLPDLSINKIDVVTDRGLSLNNLTINSLFSSGAIFPEAGITVHPLGK